MGLQVRLYFDGSLAEVHQNTAFLPDPVELVIDSIIPGSQSIDYNDSGKPFVFGSIKLQDEKTIIVIGPTFSVLPGRETLRLIMKSLGVPHDRFGDFSFYIETIPTYSIETFLQILCFINYAVNDEKKTILDILKQPNTEAFAAVVKKEDVYPSSGNVKIHNTYNMEKKLLAYISGGKPEALSRMFSEPPVGQVGRLAHDQLRQRKNTFICSATLASRAAIDGGLSHEVAFTMSDYYIQKAELLTDYNSLTNLNMDMLMDFAIKVDDLNVDGIKSKQLLNITRYINKNISEKITLENLTKEFGISRTLLCSLFKAELNTTVHSFILKQKIEEAKRLLRNTERSLSEISEFLSFSSQSYFQNTFRKQVGLTPTKFRNRS
jgi:AraC-like DNA-binding protein